MSTCDGINHVLIIIVVVVMNMFMIVFIIIAFILRLAHTNDSSRLTLQCPVTFVAKRWRSKKTDLNLTCR